MLCPRCQAPLGANWRMKGCSNCGCPAAFLELYAQTHAQEEKDEETATPVSTLVEEASSSSSDGKESSGDAQAAVSDGQEEIVSPAGEEARPRSAVSVVDWRMVGKRVLLTLVVASVVGGVSLAGVKFFQAREQAAARQAKIDVRECETVRRQLVAEVNKADITVLVKKVSPLLSTGEQKQVDTWVKKLTVQGKTLTCSAKDAATVKKELVKQRVERKQIEGKIRRLLTRVVEAKVKKEMAVARQKQTVYAGQVDDNALVEQLSRLLSPAAEGRSVEQKVDWLARVKSVVEKVEASHSRWVEAKRKADEEAQQRQEQQEQQEAPSASAPPVVSSPTPSVPQRRVSPPVQQPSQPSTPSRSGSAPDNWSVPAPDSNDGNGSLPDHL